jgi:hypothetical protein
MAVAAAVLLAIGLSALGRSVAVAGSILLWINAAPGAAGTLRRKRWGALWSTPRRRSNPGKRSPF